MGRLSRYLEQELIRADNDPAFRLWFLNGVLQPEDDLLYYRLGNDSKKYSAIEDDPFFGQLCDERRRSPSMHEPIVYPGGDKPDDLLLAAIVRKVIETTNFDHYCEWLNNAIFTGRSLVEHYYGRQILSLDVDGSQVERECYIPIRFESKDPMRLIFGKASNPKKFQHHMGFEVRQSTLQNFIHGEPLPLYKVSVHSFGSQIGNPYGKGLYRRLYWLNNFKKEVLKLGLINSDGRPIPAVSYSKMATPQELIDARAMLQDFYSNSWMMLPDSFQVNFASAFVQGQVQSLKEFLSWFDSQAATCILGATLTSGTDNQATRGNSEVHYRVTESRAKMDSDMLSETLKEYFVKPIAVWNVPGAALPSIYRDFTPPADREKEARIDTALFAMGYRPTEGRIREIYGDGYEPLIPITERTPQGSNETDDRGVEEG